LGWSPEEVWDAQLWEIRLALDGYWRKKGREDSRHAAWIINSIRPAIFSENWERLEEDDLFDPDYEPPTKEDVEDERQALAEQFSSTLE